MVTLLNRVITRLSSTNDTLDDNLLIELISTATDRINLRVGDIVLNPLLNSIVVDVVVKMYRRIYYEGISSESADTLNVSFVEDVLKEYDEELSAYKRQKEKADEDLTAGRIRFL